jgi:hypothetical protein
MTSQDDASVQVMRLRYRGTCDRCGTTLDAGARAGYLRAARRVRCLGCLDVAEADAPSDRTPTRPATADPMPPSPVEPGTAGSSARREYERRVAKREERVRAAHPRIGGLLLAITEEPQSTTAWARGARGEEMLGAGLAGLADQGVRLLHDRRIPGTRANIDHLAIGPTGVHVIDAKRYRGPPRLHVQGGILRPRVERLLVGSRDCTRLVGGVRTQVDLVGSALDAAGLTEMPTHGVLCFVDADWPLIGGSFVIDGVAVLWPRLLGKRLLAPGPLGPDEVEAAHAALARRFPPA